MRQNATIMRFRRDFKIRICAYLLVFELIGVFFLRLATSYTFFLLVEVVPLSHFNLLIRTKIGAKTIARYGLMFIPKDLGVVKQRKIPAKVAHNAKTQKTSMSDLLNFTVGVSHKPISQIVKKVAMAMTLELFEWLLVLKTSESWKSIILVSS